MKAWYDGFSFGGRKDIYNLWSIINFLDKRKVGAYWANTSANRLAGKLIREGSRSIKETFEISLQGKSVCKEIDEQIVYNQLDNDEQAIWSLLLASGYLKVKKYEAYTSEFGEWKQDYELELTNFEVKAMFRGMVRRWFSYFDTGRRSSAEEPERFYHGFVLGLMVELADKYTITSNRESGFGRYDVMLRGKNILKNLFFLALIIWK